MSLRFSPESKQPDRALREWASSDMRRNHDARLRAAKSEYGHLFSVGRANAARSPAPATPAAHGAAETRRPRPSSASPGAPTTPATPAAGGFASARNHPGSDGGAKLRAAAQTALLSPKNQARWSPPPRGASRRSTSPLADAASLGGSRLARGSTPRSATRVPSPPAAAYYASGAETPAPAPGSASASSSNHGSGSGRPSTGRSVARFLRRRQELRRRRAEEEADAATHHSPSEKKAAEEDKENVDPAWAEFDASPPSATRASLDEDAESSSRVRGGTHETPPRGTEEEEPPRAESTTGTREESADAARRGSARSSPPSSPVSRALASLPSLKTAREAPSRFAAPGFDSASPPGHRLGAKGAAHAVFAAALADAEEAFEAIDATRYPAAAPPPPDVAGAATTPTPGEDSPSPSSAEAPQSRRGNPTFADTPSPLRPFNATAANAGSTGGTAGSSSSVGPFDERFGRASAFSGGGGGGFSERAFAGASPGRASSVGDARGAADRYGDADGARYGGLDDEDSAWDEYEDGAGRRGSEDPGDGGSARDATAAEGRDDDNAEAEEPPSPFRMMVAPGALKRAAAAHARSLSLVEAANKAHEDAGGVVEYRRYG